MNKNIKANIDIFVFGIYLLIVGGGLTIIPNLLLPIFGFKITNEVWVRLGGALIFIVGYYYLVSAKNNHQELINATILGRIIFALILSLFAFQGYGNSLYLFALGDLSGAIWTYTAHRRNIN